MKTLYLSLKKEWYEMIERGEKPEEYREKTAYWIVRLFEWRHMQNAHTVVTKPVTMKQARLIVENWPYIDDEHLFLKHYDAICFSYGYTKRRIMFECKGITIGQGRPEWGAPNHETFIIKLGNKLL